MFNGCNLEDPSYGMGALSFETKLDKYCAIIYFLEKYSME